jgi:hypothetical protein
MAKTPQQQLIGSITTKWNDLRDAKKHLADKFIHVPHAEATMREAAFRAVAPLPLTTAVNPAPWENTMGVGIGEKISEGKPTGTLAVKLLVRMKFSKSDLSSSHVLPKTIDGIPTDVEEVGLFRRQPAAAAQRAKASGAMPNPRTKIRMAEPGCSIGFQDPTNRFTMAGTFGAVVKDRNALYILSNNHVLADENRLPCGDNGAPIFQPGMLDGGDPAKDKIAILSKFVALGLNGANTVDCAIAKGAPQNVLSKSILHIGAPQGTAAAAIDMAVHKFGRTTGYTVGTVSSVDTDTKVQYEMGKLTFTGQIIVVGMNGNPFSDNGDSGSLILQRGTNKALGLLMAGSSTHTIANHIDDVLEALGVTLA